LRTLAIARRPLHPDTWRLLRGGLLQARQKVGATREKAVSAASALLEADLSLLGATGVEDRLQPGVKVTLESLRTAGIKVWVLTGDKVETAVNVSVSCGHIKPGTIQFQMIDHTSAAQVLESLHAFRLVLGYHTRYWLECYNQTSFYPNSTLAVNEDYCTRNDMTKKNSCTCIKYKDRALINSVNSIFSDQIDITLPI
jgi:magnesium-transporting ATPase (P-type)